MGKLTTRHNQFLAQQVNWAASDASGVAFTPGVSNAKGSWADVFGGTVAEDTFGLWLAFHDISGTHVDTLADIGIDTAGGTSYSVLIPNLIASYASSFQLGIPEAWGHTYYFPLFVPKGSRVGVRAQQVVGTAVGGQLRAVLMQKPTHPELLKVGSFVDAVGIDTTTSRGKVLTGGPRAWSAWQLVGTAPRDAWFHQSGLSNSSTGTLQTFNGFCEYAIGDGTNFRTIVQKQKFGAVGNSLSEEDIPLDWRYATFKAGCSIYSRNWQSTNPTDTFYAAMYLVGGYGKF